MKAALTLKDDKTLRGAGVEGLAKDPGWCGSLTRSTTGGTDAVQGHRRSGVVLLLVLGMLALFSLLTATYVVFSSQSRVASVTINQRNTRAVDGEALLRQTSITALVGTDAPGSAIWGHSLLEDKYGRDAITASVRNGPAADQAGLPGFVVPNRLFAIRTNLAPESNATTYGTGAARNARLRDQVDHDDLLVGRYFTMEEGPLRGITFRIMRSFSDRSNVPDTQNEHWLDRVLVLDVGPQLTRRVTVGNRSEPLSAWLNSSPVSLFYNGTVGMEFRINGRERNGYGYGWDPTGTPRNLNQTVAIATGGQSDNIALSLLPNYATYLNTLPLGDADEPYDVPDYRDMWLGHFPQNRPPGNAQLGLPTPSFVRPALVNYITSYYDQSLGSMAAAAERPKLQNILRMLMRSTMRPLPIANAPEYGGSQYANFTGGGEGDPAFSTTIDFTNPDPVEVLNLASALARGPWDVDNDGDGVSDSVFIDAGLPSLTMADGTLVKPMAAYRIEDLSGRVDINAAGSLATLNAPAVAYDNSGARQAVGVASVYARTAVGGPVAMPGTQAVVQGGGFGYGPADIDLRALSGPTAAVAASSDNWANIVRQRYGDSDTGLPGLGENAATQVNELLGSLRKPNVPARHDYNSWQGIPMDVWGRGRVAVDPTGAPLVSSLNNNVFLDGDATTDGNEAINDPYEMAIGLQGTGDDEYQLSEFEAIARAWDWDRLQLPQRLVQQLQPIVAGGVPAGRLYRSVTPIASSDDWLPAQPPQELSSLDAYATPSHPMRRLTEILADANGGTITEQLVRDLIPLDIRMGMKLDLNRWFGNRQDDDGDGVVDDEQELTTPPPERVYQGSAWAANGDFTLEETSQLSRQQMAQDLYCLMMLLIYDVDTDQMYEFPNRPAGVSIEDFAAWKIAQWAVNVVDFRDGDAIMTRFVYDTRPFDGWDLTNVATTRVVYGMEAPELLLTENMSWHDRRLQDTPTGNDSHQASANWGDPSLDDDLDQVRMPQGTSFLELYCPRSPAARRAPNGNAADPNVTGWSPPRDLYVVDNDRAKLNLAAEDPVGNPVFRIAISEMHVGGQTAAGIDSPLARLNDPAQQPTALFQTSPGSSLPAVQRLTQDAFDATQVLQVDRIIWMSNRDPATVPAGALPADTNPRNVYWNRYTAAEYTAAAIGPAPLLGGGQYAVVGPRTQSFVGAKTTPGTADAFDYQSKQRIELLPNQVNLFNFVGPVNDPNEPTVNPRYVVDRPDRDNPNGPERIRPVVGILAAATPPAGWGNGTIPNIGLNISEPTPAANYYPEPDTTTYGGLDDTYSVVADTPFDKSAARPLGDTSGPNLQRTGTRNNFRTALLQRLADPTRQFNADTNPYITIDWMPMDLTVFNGEESETIEQDMAGIFRHIDGDDPNPFDDPQVSGANGTGDMGVPIRFGSRYKSGVAVGAGGFGGAPQNLIYSLDTLDLENAPVGPNTSAPPAAPPVDQVNFPHVVHVDLDINNGGQFNQHSTTLGYLNHAFGTRWEPQNPNDPQMVDWLGVPDQATFPWLPWFNRDFTASSEIIFVPSSAPGRLGVEFFLPNNKPGGGTIADIYDGDDPVSLAGHYGTLWNYLAHDIDTDGSATGDLRRSPNFHRLLSWLRTPQPFDNLEEMIRPGSIATSNVWPPDPALSEANFLTQFANEPFKAPFNWVSPLTRRGRINLNTVVDQDVYRALMLPRSRQPPEYQTGLFWDDFIASRRGFVPIAESPDPINDANVNLHAAMNPDFPTMFAAPFQPRETARVAPPLNNPGAAGGNNRLRLPETAAGLERPSATDPNRPLFERPATDPTISPANTPERHPFFRYDELTRLENLTTDNSNVFAMWVTIGLFEVNPSTLAIGEEYGAAQAANTRYRAFYIIDRSVPVAFEPGREKNARETILFSRILN